MLVLSRKTGERIVIGDNVEITVVSISAGRVKLGLSAPDEVAIRRAELPHFSDDAADGGAEIADSCPVATV